MNCNENSVCNICKGPFDDGLHADCGGDCLLCMATVAQDPDCALTAVPLLMRRLAEERGALIGAIVLLKQYRGLLVSDYVGSKDYTNGELDRVEKFLEKFK